MPTPRVKQSARKEDSVYTLNDSSEKNRLENQGKNLYGGASYLFPFLRGNMLVLDVGSGVGTIGRIVAAKHPTIQIVGIDASEERVTEAQRLAIEDGVAPRTTFLQGSAYGLPFPKNHFDVTNARFVLMHLTDPIQALGEMVRVTKHGGTIVLHEGFHDAIWIVPDRPHFRRILEAWKLLMAEKGQDHSIGLRLYPFLKSAGLGNVHADIVTHAHHGADPLFAAYMENMLQELPSLEKNLAGRIADADIAGMQRELSEKDSDAFLLELTVVGSGKK